MLAFSVGVEAALAHLRALNAVQVERACALGWAFRSAVAAALKLRNARAAADAARGAQEALDCFERGEPWRRTTGEESGLQDMLDARRRAREDEPA